MTIDMHSHWFPEKLTDAFRQRKSKPMIHTKADGIEYMESMFSAPLRSEQLESRLAEMDRTGVERGVISLTTVFGVEGLPAEEAIPLCRINNDGLSELCAKHPDRFSALATLPVGDIGAAITEFERAMKLPGMVGCLLPGDGFLSLKRAEKFRPLLEVVDRYQALALVHYGKTANDADPIKVDSSDNGHGRVGNLGGNIPFEIERMDHRTMIDLPPGTELPSKKFRRAPVLVDCNSLGARSIELAAEVYGSEKIVFGSDGTGFGMEWTQKAISDARISESDRNNIRHANAARAIAKVRRPMSVAAE
jgi:uncharacterized protein